MLNVFHDAQHVLEVDREYSSEFKTQDVDGNLMET